MTKEEKLDFAEAVIFGIIEGLVAYFSYQCHNGLFGFVDAAFRMIDHIKIWIPSNTMKFNMSMNNLLESGNVVFAYCDVSHFQYEIMQYVQYQNWE